MPFLFTPLRVGESGWAAIRRIIGAACVLLLGGCSAVVPAYNNAPFAIHWWLDGYADFDAVQSTRVKADLAQMQAWHRKEDLPRVVQMLHTVQVAAPGELRAEQVCAWFDDGLVYTRGFGQRSAPVLAATVPTLKPAQAERVRRELAKSAKTWRGKWLDARPAEQMDERLDKALDNVKTWYGSASPAQTALLRSQLESTPYDMALGWKELQRRHADIAQTIENLRGQTIELAQTAVEALLERSLVSPDPVYRAYLERIIATDCIHLAEFHATTSTSQRRHMADKLAAYGRDLQKLAAQAPKALPGF
jgi:hypothetical protein